MAKTADIGSKRLISLAPTAWVRWLTGDMALEALELVGSEFQWISRANDVLIKARSPVHGEFLIANEMQLRPDKQMGRRLRVYSVLGEEKYELPVYPAVVNILPPAEGVVIANHYHSEFMGLVAHQDYKVVNLWEVEAGLVFERKLSPLLPFVPILKGGQDEAMLSRAVMQLRADENIAELEPLLAFFATFVLKSEVVRRIMRWDMAVLRESPWYREILEEGIEKGFEQGVEQGIERGIERGVRQERQEMALHILRYRFGEMEAELVAQVEQLTAEQLRPLIDLALEAVSLAEVIEWVSEALKQPTNGNGNG